tara:strand:- start:2861 stop:3079 length:219 start_codon:yes stop_codon:yes gene_type:complete
LTGIFGTDIEPHDLPTLFQVAVAQENCQIELETLHDLFQKIQTKIDFMDEILKAQGEIIEILYQEVRRKHDR